jgi:hypothetical protein
MLRISSSGNRRFLRAEHCRYGTRDLEQDEAIAEADTLLLTIPNQLGVAYNAHVMEAILTTVAPALGWR